MQLSNLLVLFAASLFSKAAADFDIYFEMSLSASPTGDETDGTEITIFNGPPDCDTANSAAPLPIFGDASTARAARCIGCDGPDYANMPITELEVNGGDWGHFTLYESGGWQITPADGGPLRGTCVRDNGDDYDCTTGLVNVHGQRIFVCTSDITGVPS
ncbi:hypothetical protein C1H76_6233 [Elsinoe australis]|uniref:Uncharacterized protein n=1 Tax=Elsinoe australis TaxID=40998 RepID=A0A4U7B341_9PEZI|nr:hypothetical protein C1H76_6233 [Elsinoe australis]